MIWTVDREAALLLGGGRALLLQLAHPLVAAGVRDHSGFPGDPVGRLRRTLDLTYALVFGDRAAAAQAGRQLTGVHRRVRGVLHEPTGRFDAGTPYDAEDPALRLWVHATLIDTSLRIYDRFVAPLSPGQRAHYYADARQLASMLGIPDALTPPSIEAFEAYVSTMLAGDIAVGSTARDLARLVFRPPRARGVRLMAPVVEFVTMGLLPPAVRAGYGYPWSRGRDRWVAALATVVRRTLPAVPARVRVVPPARAAERRLGVAAGR